MTFANLFNDRTGAAQPATRIDILAGTRLGIPAGDLAIYTETAGGTRFGPYQSGWRLRVRLRPVIGAAPGATFTRFRFALANWNIQPGGGGEALHEGSVVTVTASMLPVWDSARRPYQATWNGLDRVQIAAGQTVWTDWLAMAAVPGQDIEIRLWASWDAVSRLYGSHSRRADFGEQGNIGRTTPDLTYSASPSYDPASDGFFYAPVSLVGSTVAPAASNPSVVIVGDSISRGAYDLPGGDANGQAGWAERGLAGRVGYVNAAMSGANLSGFNTSSKRILSVFGGAATHAICALGVNDAITSLAGYQQALQAVWATLRGAGVKPIQATLTGSASSTDGFQTLANQTAVSGRFAAGGAIQQTNAWLRAGAGGNPDLLGILDVADSLMDRTSAKFRTDRGVVVETLPSGSPALHPNALGHQLVAADVTTPLAALLAA